MRRGDVAPPPPVGAVREDGHRALTGDLASTYASVKCALREAGLPTPDLDARLLVTETLGVSTAQLIANPRLTIAPGPAALLRERVAARLDGQSIGRILGKRAFWSLDLRLGPETLEPRPETETVVELALSAAGDTPPALMADLGVGTGAILLSLLSEWPDAKGLGIDVSESAVRSARRNADRHQLETRAMFAVGDYGAALGAVFDLVVSNPPYIATAAIEGLSATVRDHDPRIALDGGADGLAAYRTVFAQANRMLRPEGFMVVEIDPDAHAAVIEEGARHRLRHVRSADDLSGRKRALCLSLSRG